MITFSSTKDTFKKVENAPNEITLIFSFKKSSAEPYHSPNYQFKINKNSGILVSDSEPMHFRNEMYKSKIDTAILNNTEVNTLIESLITNDFLNIKDTFPIVEQTFCEKNGRVETCLKLHGKTYSIMFSKGVINKYLSFYEPKYLSACCFNTNMERVGKIIDVLNKIIASKNFEKSRLNKN